MGLTLMSVLGRVVLLLAALTGTWCRSQKDLKLVDGAYQGLKIAIDDNVPQSHCNHLLHGLKIVLSEFSQLLLIATENRASLRDVTVLIPESWQTDSLTCSVPSPKGIISIPFDAHIQVAGSHPVFGSKPWTQQSQGCGRPGDFIQFGAELLKGSSNDTVYTHAAKLLVAEWARFRWGVFDERGHDKDLLYPMTFLDPVTSETIPNECHHESMFYSFCNAEDHMTQAPTKQNAQCKGFSALDVINNSKDFKDYRVPLNKVVTAVEPSIQFLKRGPPRIIVAVENSAVMNLQRRWEFIRKAVRRVVVYDVPDDTHIGLVVFNSVASTTAPLSKMDGVTDVRFRIGSSMPRNPSRIPESHKCLLCGLQEALRALNADSSTSSGATVILVTTGSDPTPNDEIDEMINLAAINNIRVELILYPFMGNSGTITKQQGLQELASSTNGAVFTVMNEGVGNDSKMSMMIGLMDSLLAAIRRSATNSPIIVHKETYPGGYISMAKGSFKLDDSFSKDARFAVYYYEVSHVGNTIQLTAPSGKIMSDINMQGEDGDASVIFVNIPSAERGLWHYKVENRADSHQGLHIQVTASESKTQETNLRIWTSSSSTFTNASDVVNPTIVYAELKDTGLPVLNARVVAKLVHLGTNASGSNYETIYFNLYDNGLGDPDILEGDGVYSSYLPVGQIENLFGQYELSVDADDNNGLAVTPVRKLIPITKSNIESCCGNGILFDQLLPISTFQRSEIFGVVKVMANEVDKDIFPPTRVMDLVAKINISTFEVDLEWTSPGDDYDSGKADHYIGVLANSWNEAFDFSGDFIPNMPEPHDARSKQSVSFTIEKYGQIVYIAVHAIDEAGNKGGVSNIASILVPHPPTTAPPPTSPIPISEPKGHGLTQQVHVGGVNMDDMAVVIGAIVGFLLIVLIIVTFCFVHINRKRNQHREKKKEKGLSSQTKFQTHSSLVLDKDESQDSADSAVKDVELLAKPERPLSPTHSWTASKLLHEHERRFSTTSGPQADNYSIQQAPFPDIISYPESQTSSQTPSTLQCEPPAYQPSYFGNAYLPSPYSYQHTLSHDDLPPYTPQNLFSQSSQGSMLYTISPQPSELSYPQESAAEYLGDLSGYIAAPPMYAQYQNDNNGVLQVNKSKNPPPVAPKPPLATRNAVVAAATAKSIEPKRRNITQV
ncbi:unnamed protein product [Meganyctiphanes norvegica]|uniref:VWFA domain-containing protein n=1 Tax=Meganyctiphanes norvegica TaxID=48144 RepID=A0AAV2Q2R8_MEGNR